MLTSKKNLGCKYSGILSCISPDIKMSSLSVWEQINAVRRVMAKKLTHQWGASVNVHTSECI